MNRINIHEAKAQAKAQLSKHLRKLERGERLLLCRRNVPIAEIRALPAKRDVPRSIGLAKGLFVVPASFLDPLPDELLAAFDVVAPASVDR
jgi:antitoxin (DNA-binding transcriptional repressor) of toxin-antitoxin stability system